MAIWWATAIGFIIVLGCLGGTFIHFLNKALDTDDSKRIDPVIKPNDEQLSQSDS